MNPIHAPADTGRKLNVLGNAVIIRIHGRDTNGALSVIESHEVPGAGTPPHMHHREDETFLVLRGEYEFTVAGNVFIAKQGAVVFAPRGIPHHYRSLGPEPGAMSVTLTPAGFEAFFEEVDALNPQLPQDIPRVLEIGRNYGLDYPQPPGA